MLCAMTLAAVLAGNGTQMTHQALLLDACDVVTYRDGVVSKSGKELSKDEATFWSNGLLYPNSGAAFWKTLEGNTKAFDVLGRIKLLAGTIQYDGVVVEIGAHVVKVSQALRWGDSVACLATLRPAGRKPAWWDEDESQAIVVFNPKEGKGGLLLLPGKQSRHSLGLVDPLPPK